MLSILTHLLWWFCCASVLELSPVFFIDDTISSSQFKWRFIESETHAINAGSVLMLRNVLPNKCLLLGRQCRIGANSLSSCQEHLQNPSEYRWNSVGNFPLIFFQFQSEIKISSLDNTRYPSTFSVCYLLLLSISYPFSAWGSLDFLFQMKTRLKKASTK